MEALAKIAGMKMDSAGLGLARVGTELRAATVVHVNEYINFIENNKFL